MDAVTGFDADADPYHIVVPGDIITAAYGIGDLVVYYDGGTIDVISITLGAGADDADIIRLNTAQVEAAIAGADPNDTWTDLTIPLMVEVDNPVTTDPNFFFGVDDGVGPRLVSADIDEDADQTTFTFSEDLAGSTADPNDFVITGAGDLGGLTGAISGNTVTFDIAIVDSDQVNMDPNNGITDLSGNRAQSVPTVTAKTVRKLMSASVTGYAPATGVFTIDVFYSKPMLNSAADGQALDPNTYEVLFPDGNQFVPNAGILFIDANNDGVTLTVATNKLGYGTAPADMPDLTITGSPNGDTGGNFAGDPTKTCGDAVGPYIQEAWYTISGVAGKTADELLDDNEHRLMLQTSEPLASDAVSNLQATDGAGLNLPGAAAFGTDMTVSQNAATMVLTIQMGTSANGAVAIDLPGNVSIVASPDPDFWDAADNDFSSNTPVAIADRTTPWIVSAQTVDTDAIPDGKINQVVLTFNENVTLTIAADPNDPNTITSSTVTDLTISNVTGPGGVNTVTIDVDEDGANSGLAPTVDLYLDANNTITDGAANIVDSPLTIVADDGVVPVVTSVQSYDLGGNNYLMEVNFSEPVYFDPNIDPNHPVGAFFAFVRNVPPDTVQGDDPNAQWYGVDGSDGSDGSVYFTINYGGVINPATDRMVYGTVTSLGLSLSPFVDLADPNTPNAAPTMFTIAEAPSVPSPVLTPDLFAYPFGTTGPKATTQESMELIGVVTTDGTNPPAATMHIMAFRHPDLFDPNTGQLVVDPANCSGGSTLDANGNYAMHIYGDQADDTLFSGGDPIILVVVADALGYPYDVAAQLAAGNANQVFIVTGLVNEAPFYKEWEDSRVAGIDSLDIDLSREEKIYLPGGWSLISTGINKSYYDASLLVSSPDELIDPNDDPSGRVDVEMQNIEDVFFTIDGQWTQVFTYDSQNYSSTLGVVIDNPSPVDDILNQAVNYIAHFSIGYGYYVRMDTAGVLVVLGDRVTSAQQLKRTQLDAAAGGAWNLAGFWGSRVKQLSGSAAPPALIRDYSTVWAGPGAKDIIFGTPDDMFGGCGAITLRSFVNNSAGSGAKVWDAAYPIFDLTYMGPGMGSWINATDSELYYDD